MIKRRTYVLAIVATAALAFVIGLVTQGVYAQAQPATAQQEQDIQLRFEPIRSNGVAIARSRIPGGWLVSGRVGAFGGNAGAYSLTFVPDPEHIWDGSSIDEDGG